MDKDEGEDDEDEAWVAGSTGMKEKVGVVLDRNSLSSHQARLPAAGASA